MSEPQERGSLPQGALLAMLAVSSIEYGFSVGQKVLAGVAGLAAAAAVASGLKWTSPWFASLMALGGCIVGVAFLHVERRGQVALSDALTEKYGFDQFKAAEASVREADRVIDDLK